MPPQEHASGYPVNADYKSTGLLDVISEGSKRSQLLGLENEFLELCQQLAAKGRIYRWEVETVGASQVDVLIYPGKWLLDALSALRAGDRDRFLSLHQQSFH